MAHTTMVDSGDEMLHKNQAKRGFKLEVDQNADKAKLASYVTDLKDEVEVKKKRKKSSSSSSDGNGSDEMGSDNIQKSKDSESGDDSSSSSSSSASKPRKKRAKAKAVHVSNATLEEDLVDAMDWGAAAEVASSSAGDAQGSLATVAVTRLSVKSIGFSKKGYRFSNRPHLGVAGKVRGGPFRRTEIALGAIVQNTDGESLAQREEEGVQNQQEDEGDSL